MITTMDTNPRNESWKFVFIVIFMTVLGILALQFAQPAQAQAATVPHQLTAPQVSAIVGLLRAFGVDEATISVVYAQLVPPAATLPATTVPVQPVTTPISQPAVQPPTCSLSASVGNYFGTTKQARLGWSFTPGAIATIKTTNGSPTNLLFGPGRSIPSSYQFPAISSQWFDVVYAGPIFQDTTYEMDVSLAGLTGSCTARASIN